MYSNSIDVSSEKDLFLFALRYLREKTSYLRPITFVVLNQHNWRKEVLKCVPTYYHACEIANKAAQQTYFL